MIRLLFYLLWSWSLHGQLLSPYLESVALRDFSIIQIDLHPLFNTNDGSYHHIQLFTNQKLNLPNIGPHMLSYKYVKPKYSIGSLLTTYGNQNFNSMSLSLMGDLDIKAHTLGVYIKYHRIVLDIHQATALSYGLYSAIRINPYLVLNTVLANPLPTYIDWPQQPRQKINSESFFTLSYTLNKEWNLLVNQHSDFNSLATHHLGISYRIFENIRLFALTDKRLSTVLYGGVWNNDITTISVTFWQNDMMGSESIAAFGQQIP